jgi:phytanoyl-CoA hydroxylase
MNQSPPERITDEQWAFYQEQGYVKLGKVLSDEDLGALCTRIDDIMLGKADLDYGRMLMQLDGDTGKYEDIGEQTKGHKGATLGYRKIQELEFDPLFLAYMQRPIFKEICDRHYGPQTPIATFRSMFFNKPSNKGTFLPFHQDRWPILDRDPLVTVWTALDPATAVNGCVQVIPGSHKLGIINPSHGSSFLTKEQAEQYCPENKRVFLELQPGEVALLHNWLLHGSDVNRSSTSRRAFSVCYMDARTRSGNGETFNTIFGEGAMTVEQLKRRAKRETAMA